MPTSDPREDWHTTKNWYGTGNVNSNRLYSSEPMNVAESVTETLFHYNITTRDNFHVDNKDFLWMMAKDRKGRKIMNDSQ